MRQTSVVFARRWPSLAKALAGVMMAAALLAGPLRAAPADGEARTLYEEGLRLYQSGHYDEALAKLQASYDLVPAVGLLYDMAQVHRLHRDCGPALELYRRFLEESAAGPANTIAASHLAEMEKCLADRPSDAEPALPIPLPPAPLEPAPPPLPASAAAANPITTVISTPVVAPRRWRIGGHRAAVVAGAAALTLSVATGVFAWQAERNADQVSAAFRPGQEWTSGAMSAERAGQRSQTLELVTAGGAILSGGIALWLAARD